jgi:hypothetical protein
MKSSMISAISIIKVGGDKLTMKDTARQFPTPLTNLHDPWWNSIARAMA